METLGTYLRARREQLNLSQAAMARLIGTYQPEISEWESDAKVPQFGTIKRIAKALDVQPATIMKRLA